MPTDVFDSALGRGLTVATAVAVTALVGSLAGDVAAAELVLAASLGALAVLVVWAVLGRPSVEVSDGTVVLRNVLRTVTIPWPTVVGTEVGWCLTVLTTAGPRAAWAAPRASGTARAVGRRRGGRGSDDHVGAGAVVPPDRAAVEPAERRRRHPATAEAVAAAVDARLAALRGAGHLDDAARAVAEHGLRPTVTWHRRTVGAGVALALLAGATRIV